VDTALVIKEDRLELVVMVVLVVAEAVKQVALAAQGIRHLRLHHKVLMAALEIAQAALVEAVEAAGLLLLDQMAIMDLAAMVEMEQHLVLLELP
jgi:hypothetical protein